MVFNWFRRQRSDDAANTEEAQSQSTPAQPEAEEKESSETPESTDDYLSWAKAAYQNIQKQQVDAAPVVEADAAPAAPPAVTEAEPVPPATEETTVASETVAELETIAAPAEVEPEVEAVALPEPTPEITELPVAEVPLAESVAATTAEAEIVTPAETAGTEVAEVAPEIEETVEPVAGTPVMAAETTIPEAELSEASDRFPVAAETPAPATEATETDEAAIPFWAKAEADRQARLERLKATAIETPEPVTERTAPTTEQPELEGIPDLPFDEGFLWSAEVLAAQGRRPDQISIEEITWLKKLRQGLDKTRRSLINQLRAIVGQGPLNQAAVMEIEALLLQADVGVEATDYIIDALQKKLREEALPPEAAIAYLKSILREMLDRPTGKSFQIAFAPEKDQLNIWLMTGVNGVGKTTTIGKLAHLGQKSGYRCLIAAADTFRAAAVEQVKVWGQRSDVEVIANPGKNTDPAAVVYDAIAAAQARNTELLLVDTAGRLQNKKNLMDELSKIRRIVDKKAPDAVIESLLVLDATLGQNGLRQAEVFAEAAKLSGVVLTKLDGTAKGGIALAIVQQLGLPIRFIGAGEGIEDLRPFSSYEFVEALLSG